MTDQQAEVLLAGLDDATALRVVMVLEPLGVRFQRAPWWSAVAGVATGNRFEIVIVALPENVANLGSMIREVRTSTSRSRQAALIVVCGRDRADEAAPLVGHGVNRFVVDEDIERELSGAVAHLLDIAPRFRLDRTVRIIAAPRDGLVEKAVVTVENISTSGMLVTGGLSLAPGSTVDFEIEDEDGPVRGRARVVWTSPVSGATTRRIGIRFERLASDDQQRLAGLLRGLSN